MLRNRVLACATGVALSSMGVCAFGGLTYTNLGDGTAWVGGTPVIQTMPNPQSASVNHGSLDAPQDALSQTFTTGADGFKLDKIQIYVAGAPVDSISLHLFTIAAGGAEADGFVNVSGQTDLFNPTNQASTQLTFQFFGTPTSSILQFDLTDASEVTLAPNTKYSLELWAEAQPGGSFWWRRIGASPYAGGNFYTAASGTNGLSGGSYQPSGAGTGTDTSRLAIVGPGRDTAMALFAVTAPPHITGDTNNDGLVDLNDLNNVLNNFGNNTPGNPGDENKDNVVDLNDLNNVLNNFGAHAAAGALAVPEPATVSLGVIGTGALLAGRRRRSLEECSR